MVAIAKNCFQNLANYFSTKGEFPVVDPLSAVAYAALFNLMNPEDRYGIHSNALVYMKEEGYEVPIIGKLNVQGLKRSINGDGGEQAVSLEYSLNLATEFYLQQESMRKLMEAAVKGLEIYSTKEKYKGTTIEKTLNLAKVQITDALKKAEVVQEEKPKNKKGKAIEKTEVEEKEKEFSSDLHKELNSNLIKLKNTTSEKKITNLSNLILSAIEDKMNEEEYEDEMAGAFAILKKRQAKINSLLKEQEVILRKIQSQKKAI